MLPNYYIDFLVPLLLLLAIQIEHIANKNEKELVSLVQLFISVCLNILLMSLKFYRMNLYVCEPGI